MSIRWPQSLSTRLMLAYVGAWLLAAAVAGLALAWFLRADPLRWADHSTLDLAHALVQRAQVDATGLPVAIPWPESHGWLAEETPHDLVWRVLDGHGRVRLWSSPQVRSVWAADLPPAALRPDAGHLALGGTDLRVRLVPLAAGPTVGWLQVGMSERMIVLLHSQNARRLGGMFVATAIVSILLLGAAMFLVLRQLLRPVRRISAQALALDPSRPAVRLEGQGLPRELRPLVHAFNASIQRLEDAHARQIRFLADAAHELKTPLALVRAQLELGDADHTALLGDVDQLSRQVQQWLVLAEVTEPRSYRPEPLDVAQVAAEVCERLAPLALLRGVALRLQSPHALHTRGDHSALAVLLKNLLENAIGFTPAGATVVVVTDTQSIRVRDPGPGIPPEHLPHLFDRFWRAPDRRDLGAGLGLAICREIAAAHRWQLQARNTGSGAEFALRFTHPINP